MHQKRHCLGHDKTDIWYATINLSTTLIPIRKIFYLIIAPRVTKQILLRLTYIKDYPLISLQSCDDRHIQTSKVP